MAFYAKILTLCAHNQIKSMKIYAVKTLCLSALVAATLFLNGCGGGGGAASPKEVAEKAVDALSKKDKAAVEKLLLTKAATKDLIKGSAMDEGDKQEAIEEIESGKSDPVAELNERWDDLYKDMQDAGFDYTKMTASNIEFEEEVKQGITGADINVQLTSGDKKGELRLTALKSGGWFMIPRLRFEGDMPPPVMPEPGM